MDALTLRSCHSIMYFLGLQLHHRMRLTLALVCSRYLMPQMQCSAARKYTSAQPHVAKEPGGVIDTPESISKGERMQDTQHPAAPQPPSMFENPAAIVALNAESTPKTHHMVLITPLTVVMACMLALGGAIFIGMAAARCVCKQRKRRYVIELPALPTKDPSLSFSSGSSEEMSSRGVMKMSTGRNASFAWEGVDASLGIPKLGV